MYVGQSLDIVKLKMKLFPIAYRGMFSCLLNTVQEQRICGFYTAIVPALASNYADNQTVSMDMHSQYQKIVNNLTENGNNTTILYQMDDIAARCKASVSKIEHILKIV